MKTALRWLLTAVMVAIGITHFVSPEGFVAIVPEVLPAKLALVYLSGVAEICGGLGLILPRTRRAAGLGLILLYLAVFPANINMTINHLPLAGKPVPTLLLWLRLPLQAVLIAWAYWMTRPDRVASDTKAGPAA